MTEKQLRFADHYIETGNATDAARAAGYSSKTAYSIGYENLKKPEISAYIRERLEQISAERMATADEVMEFYTSVMRGTERDQDGFPASIHDRIDAGKAILRRLERVEERNAEKDIFAGVFDI